MIVYLLQSGFNQITRLVQLTNVYFFRHFLNRDLFWEVDSCNIRVVDRWEKVTSANPNGLYIFPCLWNRSILAGCPNDFFFELICLHLY